MPHEASKEDHWVPLADLMTGMMMIFMLISIVFMLEMQTKVDDSKSAAVKSEQLANDLKETKDKIGKIALIYQKTKEDLYKRLKYEFEFDLPRWQAHLEPDLTIRFDNLQVLFTTGSATLRPEFIEILANFFPRYIRILSSSEFRDIIEEIRIEGHTSTVWQGQKNLDDAYIKNMELSQNRTRLTLEYLLTLKDIADDKKWIIAKLTANGLSSSKPRISEDGSENQLGSQRVEFRVRTNSENKLADIIEEFKF